MAISRSICEDIQRSIRSGKDSPWDLAGDGWSEYVKDRNKGFERKRNKDFAGPKSAAVEELLFNALGIEDLRGRWRTSAWASICDELDTHLERRNTIVHRFTPGRTVNKNDVKTFCRGIVRLVAYTDTVA